VAKGSSIYWVSADPKKTEHLRALDGSAERLKLFKADILDEGSFDTIVEGCECVFHTASPFYNNAKDPQVCLFLVIFSINHNTIRSNFFRTSM
jgi:hypothetical protein